MIAGFKLRHFILATTALGMLAFSSCQQRFESHQDPAGVQADDKDISESKSISLITMAIPNSSIYMTNSNDWELRQENESIILTKGTSAIITARKAEIKNLAYPNPIGLELYLEDLHKDRDYRFYEVNGLQGVRTEFLNENGSTGSDIYLLSERNDFIHIFTATTETKELNEVLDDVFLKSMHENTVHSQSKSVIVDTSALHVIEKGQCKDEYEPDYGIKCTPRPKTIRVTLDTDCTYIKSICTSEKTQIEINENNIFVKNGLSGITPLGQMSPADYNSVKFDGAQILAKNIKLPISSLSNIFNSENKQSAFQNSQRLMTGGVYLVRFADWPKEDVIVKMQINSIETNSISLTFQKLALVSKRNLIRNIEIINENSFKINSKLTEGEVTILNRALTQVNDLSTPDGFSFNYIDLKSRQNHDEDIYLDQGLLRVKADKDTVRTMYVEEEEYDLARDSLLKIFFINDKTWADVSKADFRDLKLNEAYENAAEEMQIGKIYGVQRIDIRNAKRPVNAIVQVLDINKENEWARIRFKNLDLPELTDSLSWNVKPISSQVFSKKLERFALDLSSSVEGYWGCPNIQFSEEDDTFSLQRNNSTNKNGMYNYGQNLDISTFTPESIQHKDGEFANTLDVNQGDVIGVLTDNLLCKSVLVFKVKSHVRGKNVEIETRYLYNANSNFEVLK